MQTGAARSPYHLALVYTYAKRRPALLLDLLGLVDPHHPGLHEQQPQ